LPPARSSLCQMETAAYAEAEQRMDEGPLTLNDLYKSEEGGEAFLELFKGLVEEEGGRGAVRWGDPLNDLLGAAC
jgi:hypothetical protein